LNSFNADFAKADMVNAFITDAHGTEFLTPQA
jgi:hypothetical protein